MTHIIELCLELFTFGMKEVREHACFKLNDR